MIDNTFFHKFQMRRHFSLLYKSVIKILKGKKRIRRKKKKIGIPRSILTTWWTTKCIVAMECGSLHLGHYNNQLVRSSLLSFCKCRKNIILLLLHQLIPSPLSFELVEQIRIDFFITGIPRQCSSIISHPSIFLRNIHS